MTTQVPTTIPISTLSKTGGWLLVIAAIIGAASAVFLAFVPPAVGYEWYSYPLSPAGFTGMQVLLFIHHLVIAYGLFAVWRSEFAGSGRLAAIGGVASIISMVLLAVQELVNISAADAPYPSELPDLLSSVYGVISLVNGLALIVFGIAAIRARRWQGWRRFILLIVGVYVIAPLTPAIFGPYIVGRLAIGVWFLLFAALGWALLRPGIQGVDRRKL